MCTRRSKARPCSAVVAGFALSFALGGTAVAQEHPARNLTLPGNPQFILQIDQGDRWTRLAVHTAIGGAFRRLASPECRQVLSDFSDGNGTTLQENLEATGRTAQDYLGALRYANGAGQGPCRRAETLAFTSPGRRIVYVCGAFRAKFLALRVAERQELDMALIHEMLHTLGLRENPPRPPRSRTRSVVGARTADRGVDRRSSAGCYCCQKNRGSARSAGHTCRSVSAS